MPTARTRTGLEGVDLGEDARSERRHPLLHGLLAKARSLRLLLRDPRAWSERRYRDKNTMEFSAIHPDKWRKSRPGEVE
jgi:hypothetical protein